MSPPGTRLAKKTFGFFFVLFCFVSLLLHTSNASFPSLLLPFATSVCLCHLSTSVPHGGLLLWVAKVQLRQVPSWFPMDRKMFFPNILTLSEISWHWRMDRWARGHRKELSQHPTWDKKSFHVSCWFLGASTNPAFSYAKGLMSLKVQDITWTLLKMV